MTRERLGTTGLESVLNDDFVEQYATLNIELTISDIDGWFHTDGSGHEIWMSNEKLILFWKQKGTNVMKRI